MKSSLHKFFRIIPPVAAFSMFLGGCTSPPDIQEPPASGLKEYTVEIRRSSTLSEITSGGGIEFKARCVSMSSDGLTADLELQPAYGGHRGGLIGSDYVKDATQRVTPVISSGGNVISVTSRKLAGIPMSSLRYLVVEVSASGPDKGSVTGLHFHVSGEALVKCAKTSSGKYLTTFRQGGSTFTMTLDRLNGFQDGEGNSRHNDPQRWSGELGTLVYLSKNEWLAEGIPAGPDGADFSFLETKTARGDFD
jgi:hypothetical protein